METTLRKHTAETDYACHCISTSCRLCQTWTHTSGERERETERERKHTKQTDNTCCRIAHTMQVVSDADTYKWRHRKTQREKTRHGH